jgi:hypothetical protein
VLEDFNNCLKSTRVLTSDEPLIATHANVFVLLFGLPSTENIIFSVESSFSRVFNFIGDFAGLPVVLFEGISLCVRDIDFTGDDNKFSCSFPLVI